MLEDFSLYKHATSDSVPLLFFNKKVKRYEQMIDSAHP